MQRRSSRTFFLIAAMAGLIALVACGAPTPPPTGTTYDLDVTVDGAGSGSVTSAAAGIDVSTGTETFTLDEGTNVTLTATADSGSVFAGWTGDCSGTDTCTITMDGDASVTATFSPESVETATLTVTTSGSGTGNVVSTPEGIDLDAGDDSADFVGGTTVTLTITADTDFAFGGATFTGGTNASCTGQGTASGECTVDMTEDVTVNVDFFAAADLLSDSFTIAQASDDAEEFQAFVNEFYDAGGTQIGSSDLDFTYDTAFSTEVVVGLRFQGVTIPNNAIVTSATITFTRHAVGAGSVTLDFVGEASDNASTFVDGVANENITSRPTTDATVSWASTTAWDTTAETPNLAAIVNEVVQRDGWASSNALVFIVSSDDSDSSNYRRAGTFESGNPAVLNVTYYVPPAP